MQRKSANSDAARRRLILDAARDCFLKFGYAKTSIEDIAKQAAISRPLIYLKFKSKEQIFAAVLEDIFETQYRAAEHALAKPGSKREKLMSRYEALLPDPRGGANRECSDGHRILRVMRSGQGRTLTKAAERFNLSTRRLFLVLKRSRMSSCWLSTGSLRIYQRRRFSEGDLKCRS